ncbi:hypothetical protein [Sphingomonas sp. Mn802worker]|uniref:hypothetical protein n=1 Tax=Sphingomonas sp. Mn802worker TaxID=629773 RepID=UPI00037DEDDA|nr:hypothetical protein [Sphingomonas sp. Mn802worker]
MRLVGLAVAVLLCACGQQPAAEQTSGAGAALERAARANGMVSDPARVVPTGVYGSGEDKVCMVPQGEGRYRIGVSVDLGEQQRCAGRGIARGREKLDVRMGGGCEFVASLDGDTIAFPAVLPAACDTMCEGRATLAALSAARLSDSLSEATRVEGSDGKPLCGG